MPAMSRGTVKRAAKPSKVVKPAQRAKATATSRKHHFETFSKRITKLKIDPLRRSRRPDDPKADHDGVSTYFGNALQEWLDVNLGSTFVAFNKEVAGLCDSLPKVLHNHDKIMALLVTYIEKADVFSLEPLLSLMAHFAHDLDTRFELHFQTAVATVAGLAARIEAVEAIEWCFTCLAWLFKYLSRLLVPDLRPLYDLMAPFLGKTKQRPFIIRFAAEAMSFLFRKAATSYARSTEPLDRIIAHMLDDFAATAALGSTHARQLYAQGIMTLITECIKGHPGQTIHSSGASVLQSLLDYCFTHALEAVDDILVGSLVSIIHHTDAENFEPLLSILLQTPETWTVSHERQTLLFSRIIFTITGTRKGGRIGDWAPVITKLKTLVRGLESTNDHGLASSVFDTAAVVIHVAPIKSVSSLLPICEALLDLRWRAHFLPFSRLLAELDPTKFHDILTPFLQRFIIAHWVDQETELCTTLELLKDRDAMGLVIPVPWQQRILESVQDPADAAEAVDIALNNARLDILALPGTDDSIKTSAAQAQKSACIQATTSHPNSRFIHGRAYLFVCQAGQADATLLDKMMTYTSDYKDNLAYWQGLRQNLAATCRTEIPDNVLDTIVELLSSPSHDLRLEMLELLRGVQNPTPEWLEVALSIEGTSPTMQSARYISQQIRRLALLYKSSADSLLLRAIPVYCLGIMHIRLSPAWDEAIKTLKEIVEQAQAEDAIVPILAEWLKGDLADDVPVSDAPDNTPAWQRVASDFECSNLNLLKGQCSKVQEDSRDPRHELQKLYSKNATSLSVSSANNRAQALKILHALPRIAEKRSRMLVPVLLDWVQVDQQDHDDESTNQRWSRKDQKDILSVFALFQNPRVLYRSDEVYTALLSLLSNGDIEIQRSALNAVLSWKSPEVFRYKEHLTNFLDDARLRDEVSTFLRIGDEDGIRADDCEVLMPVLLRLLYGRVVTRAGASSGAQAQQARRKAIFRALAHFPPSELRAFVSLALNPVRDITLFNSAGEYDSSSVSSLNVPPRKLFGMLNMLDDMLEAIGSRLEACVLDIADAALLCLLKARQAQEETDATHASFYANIRQTGLRLITQLFTSCPQLAWDSRAELLVDRLISHRLERLPIETAQSISGTLRLFSAWSESPDLAPFFVDFDARIVPTLADCLTVPSAQLEVKVFVIQQIFDKLLDLAEETGNTAQHNATAKKILQPYAGVLLDRIGQTLKDSPPKPFLDASMSTIARLAPFITDVGSVKGFFKVSTYLLHQPNGRVSPKIKHNLLKTLRHLLPQYDVKSDTELFNEIFDAVCPLLAFFRDRESRELLCVLLKSLTQGRDGLDTVAGLCLDLESFSVSRLDEPDYEKRSAAFKAIHEDMWKSMTVAMWKPIVYSMLFHIRDNNELAIRTSASYALRRMVEAASVDGSFKNAEFEDLVTAVLMPGLQNGCRDPSELVRTEYLAVFAAVVRTLTAWSQVSDMQVVLANDDDEASFFTNILHIQQHRRLRALHRLSEQAPLLASHNVSKIFVPLLEHFVFDQAETEGAQTLAAETSKTLGFLAAALGWQQYRATLKRFIGYIKNEEGPQKVALKLVGCFVDALHNARPDGPENKTRLRESLPAPAKLAVEIRRDLMPQLSAFLHQKDESTVSLRVPVAVTVVKLIRVLPADEAALALPGVLMDVCHILRSKDQVARDLTRRTLADITALLGPEYFGFVFKELKSALQRGPQLHVLSYTIHSILIANTAVLKPGDLNYTVPLLVSTMMDDIFGATGQEKDAEEYASKMREVKSSKSFDSMEMLCGLTTLGHLNEIIKPIQILLAEKLNHKTVSKIDELLRRVGLGVTQNPSVIDRDVLVFCYEIVQQATSAMQARDQPKEIPNYKTRKFLIQMHAANKSKGRANTTSYIFKLVRFAFDLMRSVLQKHDELRTHANLAGFLPIVGDALVGGQDEVQLSAVRLLMGIIKVQSPLIERDAPTYAAEAIQFVRNAPSMTSEMAQASLKLIAVILRERPNVKVKDSDLAFVIKRVKADIDEPDRQGVIFTFLRSVLARKVVITEVYEILDSVAEVMITNQTRSARDLARGVYFQFIMDYPQAKDRLAKQVNFVIKNLEYQHVEGRKSVLELVHLLLNKTVGDLFSELASMLFVPLVMVMANDESAECREMAGALIGKIFEKADVEKRKEYLGLLRTWLEQDEQVLLRRVALQCWNVYLGVHDATNKETDMLLRQIGQLLPTNDRIIPAEDWELLYFALQLFAKTQNTGPESRPLWVSVFRCLTFPHAWVKYIASTLVGSLLADSAKNMSSLPIRTTGGMEVSAADLTSICNSSLRVLQYPEVSEKLAGQTARNLVFLGRCFSANGMTRVIKGQDDEEPESDDDDETNTSAHGYLLSRLASILRREPASLKAPALYAKTAALQIVGSLINVLDKTQILPHLDTVTLALFRLTDKEVPVPVSSDSAFTEAYTNLTNAAGELMSLLQNKVDMSQYIESMSRVQALVRKKREGRRQKRRIERVAEPDRAEREKKRRYEGKKARRKEKGHEARDRRNNW